MPTDFLKDRVMTNTCFKKTELPRTEEGQIYYVRSELSSTMAQYKHERHMSERTVNARHLCHLFFFLKKEAGTKNWLGFHILVFFLTKNKQQKREFLVIHYHCQTFYIPVSSIPCLFFGFPHYNLLVYGTTASSTGLPGTPLGAVYLTHTLKTNFKFLLCNNNSS